MRQALVTQIKVRSIAGLLVWLCCAASVEAIPAPQNVVMYEVNLRAFSQAGDLAGVTARLDQIQSLGANVLWLMPIHPIGQERSVGQLGSPYSVRDYGAVSSEYGSLSDLTTLVTAAHDRGMFVLMDWVANHTAWDNPWITAHPDWYTHNAQGEIISPPGTNWLDVADLNYSSTAMRSAMISEMQYWVSNAGIDGYRADAADLVPFDFWQQAIPAVRGVTQRPLLMLAEGARSDHYDAGFDLTFGWDFYDTVKSVFNSSTPATALGASHTTTYSHVPAGKSILQFTTNHDESAFDATPVELFGGLDASLAAYAVTVAYGGTPLVYDGQEIGWSQNVPIFSKSPLDWTTGQDTAAWYAQLLEIRKDHDALRSGTLTDMSGSDVAMLMRKDGGDQVLVLINTRDHSSQVQVPAAWQGSWFDQFSGDAELLTATHTLGAYQVLILAAAPLLAGDYNHNGIVDAADYTVWRDGLGTKYTQADYDVWRAHFGQTAGSGTGASTSTAVPEPATVLMLMIGITPIICRRHSKMS